MIQTTSINEVIVHLDNIIEWSKKQNSRIGYFATLYRSMTIAVQKGIANNSFKDGKRMERLDTIFANRYLQAWYAYVNKQTYSNAWRSTFSACDNGNLVVLQHLLLGINTHINLDLGIAAAETCPGDKIHDLREDFEKINDVIASLMQTVQDNLSKVWWPLKMLTKISNNRHEAVLNFSIDSARKASWANAVALAVVQGDANKNYITMMDNTVVRIGNRIMDPGLAMGFVLQQVRRMEDKNVTNIIGLLK